MDVFIGEIRPFAFGFAPKDWALCNGALVPIAQNPVLYSLIGTAFGGNGTTNFGLPNLQGNIAIGAGQGLGMNQYRLGDTGGVTEVTLDDTNAPSHSHTLPASSGTANKQPAPGPGFVLGATGQRGNGVDVYIDAADQATSSVTMLAGTVNSVGTAGPHTNVAPFLTVNYCICLQGLVPPRNLNAGMEGEAGEAVEKAIVSSKHHTQHTLHREA